MKFINEKQNWETQDLAERPEHWAPLGPGVECLRLPGHEPVRRIITGHRPIKVSAMYSWKNGQHVAHESAGEERCARVLEVHPAVTAYFGQPEQLRFQVDGKSKPVRYTPDFLVMFGHRELRIEYKPYDLVSPPAPVNDNDEEGKYRFEKARKLRERLATVAATYQRCGIEWQFVTDRDLDCMASKDTVDEIIANAGRPVPVGDLSRLIDFLKLENGSAPLKLCEQQLEGSDFPRGDLLARVPERTIEIDLFGSIEADSMVSLGRDHR